MFEGRAEAIGPYVYSPGNQLVASANNVLMGWERRTAIAEFIAEAINIRRESRMGPRQAEASRLFLLGQVEELKAQASKLAGVIHLEEAKVEALLTVLKMLGGRDVSRFAGDATFRHQNGIEIQEAIQAAIRKIEAPAE